jgi:aldehyde:ferredoxin oxidoreductase
MIGGYWAKLLRINLSTKEAYAESISEDVLRHYIGGSGLATKYLYDEVAPFTDAFSPENKVYFATGPFQAVGVPGGGKWSVVSKSPLTRTFAVATAGAEWGFRMKKTGYDMFVIEGQSEEPVYLWIKDEEVAFRPAERLWGKDTLETIDTLTKEIGDSQVSVATIGPAGEQKVNIACIVADKHSFAGRCGLGAVLGAKRLKAIVVKGTNRVPIEDTDEFRELAKESFSSLRESARETLRKHGTPILVSSCEEVGDLPVKNWDLAVWKEGAARIGAPTYTRELHSRSWPCMHCPVGCHRHIETQYEGEEIEGAGAEYETLGMLGSNCLVDDLSVISKANDICNRLGIDTISAGAYVSFLMDCYENGLVAEEDLNGKKAQWGDGKFVIDMVNEIGRREGVGALFAEGIRNAADKIGKEARKLTVDVKNLDLPAHDPRSYFSLALNYATGVRGACHLRGYPHIGEGGMLLPEVGLNETPERFNLKEQVKLTALFQDLAALHDSLVICIFIPITGLSLQDTSNFLNTITGWDTSPQELMKAGNRIVTLQRQINVRDGLSRKDDKLPAKMYRPAEEGFRKGKVPEPFEATLALFYEYRGWDEEGKPKTEKLAELSIQ